MMHAPSHQTCEPSAESVCPTLWIECLPSELQVRIAHYVSDGKSGLDALNLAKVSPLQRHAVSAALHHTLKGSFATHADDLVNDWVDVFEDVRVLELREHPPNFHLLSSPSLRVLIMEDEPLQLEALGRSDVHLDRLELTMRFNTPSYLVCRFLAEVTFKTFVLYDIEQYMLRQHCSPSELVAACQGVQNVILKDHCWIHNGIAEFLTSLPSLRELFIDIQGMGSLSDLLPVMKKLERVGIIGWDSQVSELLQLAKETQTQLKELTLNSFEERQEDDSVALFEALREGSELEELTVQLSYGSERIIPRMPYLTNLKLLWRGELEMLDEDDEKEFHYKPNEGVVVKMIEAMPSLASLCLFDVRLSEADVSTIIKMLGGGLKEFGMSIDSQDSAPHRMLLTVLESVSTYATDFNVLDLRYHALYCVEGFASCDKVPWSVKQEMLLRLDRLHRQFPEFDPESVENLIMHWTCEDENEKMEEGETKADAWRKALALRRCRRGMNIEGGASHLVTLAGLLETGCEGLEQDLDAAIDLYKQAVWMGDTGDAIMKLWVLTEKRSTESSESTTGGALELILEMERRKVKTLAHFAELFYYGTGSTAANYHAAEKVLQLAVDHGYRTPCAMMLATIVGNGYDDQPPDFARAVDLYKCVIADSEDANALCCLADLVNKGYANEPPNPAEARVYLERGVRKKCSRCMYLLGLVIQNGYEGVQSDLQAAIDMFQQAVDHGSKSAVTHLGAIYTEGVEGFPSNPCKAVEFFEKVISKHRHPSTLRQLGSIIETGYAGHAPNPKRAAELYERAVEGGDMGACTQLANLVAYGYEDVPRNPNKAIRLLKKVIDAGSKKERARAQRYYGYLLLQGSGELKPDPWHAAECFREAIEAGDCRSARALGDLLRDGYGVMSPDPAEACNVFQRAIEENSDPVAMRKLASIIKRGYGDVKPDPVRAVELYRRAIDAGSVSSCCSLARMFEKGYEGIPQNLEDAAELYKKGADAGDPEAICRLGRMLEKGFCAKCPNPVAAIELYNRAINGHKYGKAMLYLARTLEKGYLDKPPDPKAAKALFERGAAAGDQWSKICMARLIEVGYADEKPDIGQARLIYSKIVAGDYEDEVKSDAMYFLGGILEKEGADDPSKLVEAADWFRRSLEKSEWSMPLYRLAVLTRKGVDGAPPDVSGAVALLWRAVDCRDNGEPFFELADILRNGYDAVEPDVIEAERLDEEGSFLLWTSLPINA